MLRIDGKEIEDVGDVRSFIQSRKEQSPVNIDLLRDGKQISVQVTPTSEERSFFGGPDRPYIGVELQELNRDLASYFNVAPGSGALIVHVEPDSPAEKAGILSGDVITHFNGKQVESPEDVIDQIQDLEDGQSAEISLLRHGKQMHLTVTPEMREGRGFFPQHWNMPDALGIPEQEQLRKDIEREMTDVKKELEVIRKYKFDDLKKEMDQLRKELDSLKNDQTH